MKKILTLLLLITVTSSFSQVGINTTTPDASSMLDISSTDKGILIPRMTQAQRVAIATPATSLLIYQTDGTTGFWFYNGTTWVNLNSSSGEFKSISGLVQNTTSTAADDFVFGSTSLANIAGTNDDYRMFYDKSKGAFRAGDVTGTQWDDVNVGNNSTAFGYNTTASGGFSTAIGNQTIASGAGSVASGFKSIASGDTSTAIGSVTIASGIVATAMGAGGTASGFASTVMGTQTTASANNSTAMGYQTTASGGSSIAMGAITTASGDSSIAMGSSTVALGNSSTALGTNNTAPSFGETVLGAFATTYTPVSATAINSNDRIFSVGNGTSTAARSNAMTIFKNGNFLVGSTSLSNISGANDDIRMFFNKSNGAFRAGGVLSTEWDDVNVGGASTAFGLNTKASGNTSTAMGIRSSASGDFSIATGDTTNAIGQVSTAMGYQTTASGLASTALGINTIASANGSISMGQSTTASGSMSTAMGNSTVASGLNSTAFGSLTISSGEASTAMGISTSASGDFSIAIGDTTSAIGVASTAMGYQTSASGWGSIALGFNTSTTGWGSIAMGQYSTATGNVATAMGTSTTASADSSISMGYLSTASGAMSIATGISTVASGWNSSALGNSTTASGAISTAMGEGNVSPSYGETVLGVFATTYTPASVAAINSNDRVFSVGNGTSTSARSNAMTILKNGRVGIGTVNPTKGLLEINGGGSPQGTLPIVVHNSGSTSLSSFAAGTYGAPVYSIWASGNIAATQFQAYSDARIKKVLGVSESANDLQALEKIEVTNYKMIDTLQHGNKLFKKVIAQQVEKVYPIAVTGKIREFIPNIYKISTIQNGIIPLATNIKMGDRIKLLFEDGETLANVIAVNEKSFEVDTNKSGNILVYGTEVDDFKAVDYEALSMLNISATQELLKRIKELELEKNKLFEKVEAVEKNQASVNSRLEQLESFFIKKPLSTTELATNK